MKIVDSFPRGVVEVENVWIPMPDGVRLAARLFLPEGGAPAGAIVEAIPYRKRDMMRTRDDAMYRWLAGHGYAGIRIDVRGSGDSEGVLLDEYLPSEQEDAVAAIAWIAAQPWCNGRVGMMGKSWGGFAALQVAARRPPALVAVIAVCASDDRYTDDAHYMGGCLLEENLIWGSVFFAYGTRPPDPAVVGPAWRDMWRARLEAHSPAVSRWLRHPHRDEYWRQGSVRDAPGAIACPVLAMSGWADGYSNAVPRLVATLPRCWGVVGPWGHQYPHEGAPGPAIGFLQESLRWWDQWLGGQERGWADEPRYRVWMQEHVPPPAEVDERPGRWIAEPAWPSDRVTSRRWGVRDGVLVEGADSRGAPRPVSTAQTIGHAAGNWCGFGAENEAPRDQRDEDARCLAFDGSPLGERLEILGAPVMELELASDQAQALVAVRLEDVAPDGSSLLVTYGVLNLSHRDGHAAPALLEPDVRVRVRVSLNDIAHAFPSGHRLRVTVSNTYWPLVWPSPFPVTLTVFPGGSGLELPVRPARTDDDALRRFAEPEEARTTLVLEPPEVSRATRREETAQGTMTSGTYGADASGQPAMYTIPELDLRFGHVIEERFSIAAWDPTSAAGDMSHDMRFERDDWSVRIRTATSLRCTETELLVNARIEAYDGDSLFFRREWQDSIPRRFV